LQSVNSPGRVVKKAKTKKQAQTKRVRKERLFMPEATYASRLSIGGGMVGTGQQWMSWIDVRDMVGGIHHILKNDLMQGPVNMVAPKPVRNEEFARTLASVLSRPAFFPMPVFAVKTVFGEMGEELLLGSQKVEPGKLISSGYPFRYRDLRASLEALLGR